jgi:hypothetical protein
MKQILSHFRLLVRAIKKGDSKGIKITFRMLIGTIRARVKGAIMSWRYSFRIMEKLIIQRAEFSAIDKYTSQEK